MLKCAIPKASASLIILREAVTNTVYDYEIFMARRKSTANYGGNYVFPGGNTDPIDYSLYNSLHKLHIFRDEHLHNHIKRITALRESFEEVGLFFLQKEIENENDIQLARECVRYIKQNNNNEFDTTGRAFQMINSFISQPIGQIYNFIRFVTPQHKPQRFDTQFFVHFATPKNTLNWNLLYKDDNFEKLKAKDLTENWSNIHLNEEFDDYKWMSPAHALKMFYSQEIKLANPQVLILNMLSSFESIEELQSYLIFQNTKRLEIYKDEKDLHVKNPMTFPYLLYYCKSDKYKKIYKKIYPESFVLPWDNDYPIDKILEKEERSEFKKEFKKKLESIQITGDYKGKIFFKESEMFYLKDFITEFQYPFESPFKYFNDYKYISELINI